MPENNRDLDNSADNLVSNTPRDDVRTENISSENSERKVDIPQHQIDGLIKMGYEKGYKAATRDKEKTESHSRKDKEKADYIKEENNNILDNDQNKVENLVKQNIERYIESQKEQQEKELQSRYVKEMANQLSVKVDNAKNKIPDFEEVVSKVDFINHYPDILEISNVVDNSGEVLYELAKNPQKMAVLRMLDPRLQEAQIKELSRSIDRNRNTVKHNTTMLPDAQRSFVKDSGSDNNFSALKSKYRV